MDEVTQLDESFLLYVCIKYVGIVWLTFMKSREYPGFEKFGTYMKSQEKR